MTLLNRDALLKKEELELRKVDLGKDDFVYVRQMTGFEKEAFESSIIDIKDSGEIERKREDFRAKLAVCTVCDDKGKLILKSADIKVLSRSMSAARLTKIADVASAMNKLDEGSKEELEKNSEGGQAASSISDSVES